MLIPDTWSIPHTIKQRMGERAGRQRAMEAEEHLLLVLHRVPKPGVPEREGVLFWRSPHGTWQTTGRGEGLNALQRHVETFAEAVDHLEAMYEKASDVTSYYRVIGAIVPIHRSASHLHAALQGAREMIADDRDIISLRDRAGEIERAAELLHADALNAVNFLVAQRSEELAESSHRLSLAGHRLNTVVTLLLPVTALAGVFGMNMSSGLEGRPPWLFWTTVAVAFLVGLAMREAVARAGVRRPKYPEDADEILRSATRPPEVKKTPELLRR